MTAALTDWTGPEGLPRFDLIGDAAILPAIDAALAEAGTAWEAIASSSRPATFDNTLLPMERAEEALDRITAVFGILSDALSTVGRAMIDTVYKAAMKPVTDRLGGLLGQGLNGLVSNVMPFAKGGVVSGATAFPMRGGTGLMGEAGPEAIMPLSRGPDGTLGVRSDGGRAPSVTINISTPDVAGFRRSQSQIAAEMSRLMARGARNR